MGQEVKGECCQSGSGYSWVKLENGAFAATGPNLLNCSNNGTQEPGLGTGGQGAVDASLKLSVEEIAKMISCKPGLCGFGFRNLNTGAEAFQAAHQPLLSWSVVKLPFIAAFVQRLHETRPDYDFSQFEQMKNKDGQCGGRVLLDDIYFSLVQSFNPNPSCVLQQLRLLEQEPFEGEKVVNVLDYVKSFTDPARFAHTPPLATGTMIPGFELCRWAPTEGGPAHYSSANCQQNRMSPWSAVELLSRLWLHPQLRFTRDQILRYLTERNRQLRAASPELFEQTWPVLNRVFHKTGAVPVGNGFYNFSDIGYLIHGNCRFAYSYFDEEGVDSSTGVQKRFRFIHEAAKRLCPGA
jgi:hypothetical protein